MDFLMDLLPSSEFTKLHVVVDMLTKMHFIPCRGLSMAHVMVQLFVQHVFRLRELLDKVISDRGTQFTAQFWKELLRALEVQECLPSAYHPELDGGMEKVIGILEQYLCCFISQKQDKWANYLVVAKFAFNNFQHTFTNMTPFLANVGYHPQLFPLMLVNSPVPAANNYLAELQAVYRLIRRQLDKDKENYKKVVDWS